ncbi:MAG: transposase [Verrucomicrobiota bacterium]
MLACSQMIKTHLPGILSHWKRRTTNAFLEALNSVFSAVKRKARGFRSTGIERFKFCCLHAARRRVPMRGLSSSGSIEKYSRFA